MKLKSLFSGAGFFPAALLSLAFFNGNAQITTFNYTGALQTYTVPAGITSIRLEAWGAQGQGGNGGNGGYARGDMTVTPGQVLNIYVGGQAGYNGGGLGYAAAARNGGGASDIRVTPYALANRVIVAGGGGAGGPTDVGIRNGGTGGGGTVGANYAGGGGGDGYGGNGGPGGVSGGSGNTSCHSGGAGGGGLTSGGAPSCNTCYGGTCGQPGSLGQGGNSDTWENGICYTTYGGTNGGGGGYYGGGGSSVGNCGGGGGGGGSTWVGTLTNITMTGGIRNGNGQIVITVLNGINITQSTQILCFGQSTASITAVPFGGTAPYTYSWAPAGGTSATASGLAAATYTVTVTDAAANVTSQTFIVTQPSAMTVSPTQTNVDCSGNNNGSAMVVVTGGTPGYAYSWSPSGGTSSMASNLIANTYSCSITDANGCFTSQTFSITQPSPVLAVAVAQTNISCNGGSNGSATVAANGGTPGYTYSWAPSGGTAATASTLAPGGYTCTVTDANGCTTTQTFNLTEPSSVIVNASHTDVLCNGGATGTAAVVATGGTPGYTYMWTPSGGTSANASGLVAGAYICTVTDANGCATAQTVTITEPSVINANALAMDVTCFGGSDGSIDLTVSGGTGPYTFDWNSGTYFTEDISGLTAGTYVGVLTDANGCTTGGTVTITEPTAIVATTVVTNPSTCGGSDGGVDLSVTGGTAGYTYLWSTSATTEDISGLSAGTYSVTITDANGCTTTSSATLTDPNPPTVSLSLNVSTICADDASVTLTGGSPAGGVYSGPAVAAGVFDPSSTVLGANTITYTYTDAGTLCTSSSTDMITVNACVGIVSNSSIEDNFIVMPNPNNGNFTLQLNTTEPADVLIFDALGQLVSKQKVQPGVQLQLNIAHSGVYMITVITTDGKRSSKHVVVNK